MRQSFQTKFNIGELFVKNALQTAFKKFESSIFDGKWTWMHIPRAFSVAAQVFTCCTFWNFNIRLVAKIKKRKYFEIYTINVALAWFTVEIYNSSQTLSYVTKYVASYLCPMFSSYLEQSASIKQLTFTLTVQCFIYV